MSKHQAKDSLGDRMKTYESVSQNVLTRRTPVILRLDGKAWHTYTSVMQYNKPYDDLLIDKMANLTQNLVDSIQGAVLGYTQSDEISILLVDYVNVNTSAWFDNNVQKMCSVSASMATAMFNKGDYSEYSALFDCRAFNLPKEEVCNYFIWRQNDATRNSIQGYGQHFLGHKQCQGLNNLQVQDKLMQLTPPINWNDVPTSHKRGVAYTKQNGIDFDIPIFTQDRLYIDNNVFLDKLKKESNTNEQ